MAAKMVGNKEYKKGDTKKLLKKFSKHVRTKLKRK